MERHESETGDALSAGTALEALQATRREVGRRLVTPWWYHPVLGLLLGGLLASVSTRSLPVIGVAAVAALIGIPGLAIAYRSINGVWVSGVRRGKTSRAITVYAVVVSVVIWIAMWLEDTRLRGAAAVGGLVLAVAVTAIGAWWDRLFRAESDGTP